MALIHKLFGMNESREAVSRVSKHDDVMVHAVIWACRAFALLPRFAREITATGIAFCFYMRERGIDVSRPLRERQDHLVGYLNDEGSGETWDLYGMYKARARYWLDVVWAVGASEKRLRKSLASLIEDPAIQTFKQPTDGRVGNLAAFTHSGSFPLAILALGLAGVPTSLMYRGHGPLNQAGASRLYERFGVQLIRIEGDHKSRSMAAEKALDALREGRTLAIAVDVPGSESLRVQMAGSITEMAPGPASFARASRKPVIPIAIGTSGLRRTLFVGDKVKIDTRSSLQEGSQKIADGMSRVMVRQGQPWEPPQSFIGGYSSLMPAMGRAVVTANVGGVTFRLRPALPHPADQKSQLRRSIPNSAVPTANSPRSSLVP